MGLISIRRVIACFRGKNCSDVEDETTFLTNGSMLLEQLISICDGKYNPIHSYSERELQAATNNYDDQLILRRKNDFYTLYKGFLQDQPVTIKTFEHNAICSVNESINEMVFTSIFCTHKNVLKLLGCCLETQWPILVFEYSENGNLYDRIFNSDGDHVPALSWNCRLKIAVDLSNVVAYLHNLFPKPVIHRNVIPRNILLNKNNAAKLSDFSFSIAIPEGEFQVEDKVIGTYGYAAPEYVKTGCFDEKIDVYSVGAMLLELLTRKRIRDFRSGKEFCLEIVVRNYIEENRLNEIVDARILEEVPWPNIELQLQAFASVALQCLLPEAGDRPTIIEVSKQLNEIYRSTISP